MSPYKVIWGSDQPNKELARPYLERAAARIGDSPSDHQERDKARIALAALDGEDNSPFSMQVLDEAVALCKVWEHAEDAGEIWKLKWRRVRTTTHYYKFAPPRVGFPKNGTKVVHWEVQSNEPLQGIRGWEVCVMRAYLGTTVYYWVDHIAEASSDAIEIKEMAV